jgi:hypothetical protein
MAVATAVALGTAALSAGQAISGAIQQREANQAAERSANAIAQMRNINQLRSLQVPTLGTELAQQNIQQQQQQMVQAAREQGPAGVLGSLPAVAEATRKQNLGLAAQANDRQAQLEAMRLQGAQQASMQGRQNVMAGLGGIAQAGSNLATMDLYNNIYGQNNQIPSVQFQQPTGTLFNPVINQANGLQLPFNVDYSSFGKIG